MSGVLEQHVADVSQAQPASANSTANIVRRLPYPYSAMLAICSDLDETPDREVYWESARFLNTTQATSMGTGVGLEVGNTIYFDMPSDQFAYWSTDDAGRDMVHRMIRSGHIDCLHSFGDFASTRADVTRALEALSKHDCRLEVWIDHAVAPTNLGADIMQGSGDMPGEAAYHTDLTCGFGVKYVWRGRVTSVIGQNTARKFGGVWTPRHPIKSAETVLKEVVKTALASAGTPKYEMHGANDILRDVKLRDGRKATEFFRSNPAWGGVSYADTALGIPEALTKGMLKTLIRRKGVCILYTHLGKIKDRHRPFPQATCDAFRMLADYAANKDVLVTTTRRILGYCNSIRKITVSTRNTESGLKISAQVPAELGADFSKSDVAGLTIYTDGRQNVSLFVNERSVDGLIHNPADETGRPSVSVPWGRLEFPA